MSKFAIEILDNIEVSIFHRETVTYFDISLLQQKQSFIVDDLFQAEDFVVPPASIYHRDWVRVKLGYLFYEYIPGGKCSFQLKIKYIDINQRVIRDLFSYTGHRYPLFSFDDLVPLSLYSFYSGTVKISRTPDTPEILRIKTAAHEIRTLLMNISMARTVNLSEFSNHATEFFAGIQALTTPAPSLPPKTKSKEYDVSDFAKNFSKKPTTSFELASKLAVSFLSSLGVDNNAFQEIINEYLEVTQKKPSELNPKWLLALMSLPIDKGRYTLSTILPLDEMSKNPIQQCIDDYLSRPLPYSFIKAWIDFLKQIYKLIQEYTTKAYLYFFKPFRVSQENSLINLSQV